MDLAEFIAIIRKWKWLVLPVVILVTGYTLVIGLQNPKSYSSESSIVFGLSQLANSSGTGISIVSAGDRISATYGEMITSEPVLSTAITKAGIDGSIDSLSGRISSSQPKNTNVILIDVVDSDPNRAIVLSNAVAESFVDYIQQVGNDYINSSREVVSTELASIENDLNNLTNQGVKSDDGRVKALLDRRDGAQRKYTTLLDQMVSTGDIRIADSARTAQQVGTTTLSRTGIGFVLSLLVGIVLAFVAEAVFKALRPEEHPEAGGKSQYKPQIQVMGEASKSDS